MDAASPQASAVDAPGGMLVDRAVVRISGPDAAGFLQGLVTNDVSGDAPVWAGLLSPQGKLLFDFLIWPDGDDRLIDCEATAADALIRRLSLYRLRRAIGIAHDESLAVHWSVSVSPAAGQSQSVADPRCAALGQRWLAAPEGRDCSAAYHAHRLALGIAEGAAELGSDRHLWLECNAAELNGVSFTKGCYIGQENTARMNWRSKVNRRIIVVPLDQADPRRQIIAYPALQYSVEHRRIEDIPLALAPSWMRAALAPDGAAAVQD